MAKSDSLKTYKEKRNFKITPEPEEGGEVNEAQRSFVIQKHWATRLHYDFRLELNGTMKSWAIPKGPSLDTRDKRLAVHVEDHPISYNTFEGEIPAHQYGAGKVIIWDKGTWFPIGDPQKGYHEGNLKFTLFGHKLQGQWALIRLKGKSEKKEPWLLIKEKDDKAQAADHYSIVDALPDSVAKLKAIPPSLISSQPSPNKRTTNKQQPSLLPGAIKSPLPVALKPQLATLVDKPPRDSAADSQEWLYEIKFDGYRLLARIDAKKIHLFTRNGHDWRSKLQSLLTALKNLALAPGWLDGEIVVLNAEGIPDFQALQGAFDQSSTDNIIYYIFDLPFYDGFDLRGVTLMERKQLLKSILTNKDSPLIRFSDTFDVASGDVLSAACRLGLEGVIGKRKTSHYISRRTNDWIKLKCGHRQEFVIGGYTDPQGSRTGLGSLLLGVYEDQNLHFCGNVGSGFDTEMLNTLKQKLMAITINNNPFSEKTGLENKAHWVKPILVTEVSFSEWTKSGRIRQAVFHGLRTDKSASSIKREKPTEPSKILPPSLPTSFKITHPERIVDATTKTTKREVVEFYGRVAPLMMEHLKGRPVSLVRAPDGIGSPLFFQKHMESTQLPGINLLDQELDPGHASLLEIAKPQGLWSAAQMNVIEFHTWNATKTNIDKPDRMTFDLDPGEGVTWALVQESAHLLREFLHQLGLVSFIKTSGGKGVHIVVPLKRLYGWDIVKYFSQAIVTHLARTLPQRFSAKSGPRNRQGKIFIDYLRNGFGATTVAAWSLRARPGLGVSVPIEWDELDSIVSSAHWTITNIDTRLALGNTPWKSYAKSAQALKKAINILGFQLPLKNS